MPKFLTRKIDIGFIFIDHQVEKLAGVDFYYDYLTTAK